jgi:hypothetical protein
VDTEGDAELEVPRYSQSKMQLRVDLEYARL